MHICIEEYRSSACFLRLSDNTDDEMLGEMHRSRYQIWGKLVTSIG